MIRDRVEPLSAEAKHQVLAGGAMGSTPCTNGGHNWLASRYR
jgi:hypothetical protein